jgi:iron(III) transport system substrate-binding protein
LVADGVCDLGFTDTDDFFVAVDEAKPVAMLPVRVGDGRVICMPNTVAIIAGTQRLGQAKQLVDFLLSERVELDLAASASRQIPLGPVDTAKLSDDVRRLKGWAEQGCELHELTAARRDVLKYLQSEPPS